jgi:hypothetical protein
MARVLAGRTVDLDELFDRMADSWATAFATLVSAYGG